MVTVVCVVCVVRLFVWFDCLSKVKLWLASSKRVVEELSVSVRMRGEVLKG